MSLIALAPALSVLDGGPAAAELVAGGWLAPPPAHTEAPPPRPVAVPVVPVVRRREPPPLRPRPAPQRPAPAPLPNDGKVRF